jgi:hypothetical protein
MAGNRRGIESELHASISSFVGEPAEMVGHHTLSAAHLRDGEGRPAHRRWLPPHGGDGERRQEPSRHTTCGFWSRGCGELKITVLGRCCCWSAPTSGNTHCRTYRPFTQSLGTTPCRCCCMSLRSEQHKQRSSTNPDKRRRWSRPPSSIPCRSATACTRGPCSRHTAPVYA